jgi:hypothetical protein
LYRDENENVWSEGGCMVGKLTTATQLHCLCNHASIFAGTQFTIPNSLPTLNIFDFNYEDFKENPILLITVCVITALYILGMILCWFLDRNDKKRHVGITIMADVGGDPNLNYYLIAVKTGKKSE